MGLGESENRIKGLKLDVAIDRISCARFVDNQLRAVMTAASFLLFQEPLTLTASTSSFPVAVPTIADRRG